MNLDASSTKITITTSAKAIGASSGSNAIYLAAPSGNTGDVFLGGKNVTTANGYPIAKGTTLGPIEVGDVGKLYVVGTAEDKLNVLVLT